VAFGKPPYLPKMTPDLTDEETTALVRLLSDTINNDRYPLSPRIQTLKAILAKLRPGAGTRALAAAQGVCATARHGIPKAARRR